VTEKTDAAGNPIGCSYCYELRLNKAWRDWRIEVLESEKASLKRWLWFLFMQILTLAGVCFYLLGER
jgi:hypothetical protein